MTAYVGTTDNATPNNYTQSTLSLPLASTVVGHLNLLWVVCHLSGTNVDPLMGSISGWTKNDAGGDGASPSVWGYLLSRVYQSGDPSSVTASFAGGNTNAVVVSLAYSGCDPTTPFDNLSIGINNLTGTSKSTGTINTTTSGPGIIVSGFGDRSGGGYSAYSDTFRNERINSLASAAWAQDSATDVAAGSGIVRTATGPSSAAGVNFILRLKAATTPFSWAHTVQQGT